MVDYNRQKKRAIDLIDAFTKKGTYNEEDISFFIMRETGFSKKFTKSYIADCLDRQLCKKHKKTGVLSS